ncbi:hypothetical protein FPOAC1_006898 [Fusarium poae]|uniref:hypothetical protein n=1 Tax=Fusarium poae TaxID=36050 RepID=UPI001CE7E680|nr:hypothetical protein FPOAC1_006898 [Fusarium poae]KAG8673584.1 hypothetical protein FPOAC1_006898 [Fusarium poae]
MLQYLDHRQGFKWAPRSSGPFLQGSIHSENEKTSPPQRPPLNNCICRPLVSPPPLYQPLLHKTYSVASLPLVPTLDPCSSNK